MDDLPRSAGSAGQPAKSTWWRLCKLIGCTSDWTKDVFYLFGGYYIFNALQYSKTFIRGVDVGSRCDMSIIRKDIIVLSNLQKR